MCITCFVVYYHHPEAPAWGTPVSFQNVPKRVVLDSALEFFEAPPIPTATAAAAAVAAAAAAAAAAAEAAEAAAVAAAAAAEARKLKPTAVFLVTQCRSGSSILGELFNRRERVTYLYEPLYPFRESNCVQAPLGLVAESVQAVEDMARCRFDRLPGLYANAFRFTNQSDEAG